ncbi:PREDICTED: uncharacterized protein LOC107404278 [Olea europaea subsp. europaea]|uniref:PREDICTED: uncharacterized protein LOC107404278 n=1 Tax=Olea europaea subsp. europaea TaxID=158383 RepID=A0A8S0SDP5_OLEEU|nr:PREDICTED: uncharacterized protein LOC107404278 [Olea europaea subsp. europaea]
MVVMDAKSRRSVKLRLHSWKLLLSAMPITSLLFYIVLRSKHEKSVEWTSKDLLKGFEKFLPIYETRPIKKNTYGTGFDHSFGLWFIAQWLKPDLMVKSGSFKGHSTCVLRRAMLAAPILSLSPGQPQKYLKKGPVYVDENRTYFAGKDFVDFGSMNWGRVIKKNGISDLSRVLVFFDDHQNEPS